MHSWNGKYRRPTGLATPDYQKPMHGDLLWVYEGLTQYLGYVLTGRTGLNTYAESREDLALVAGYPNQRQGRMWRPLQDTADAASILYFAAPYWSDWRRGTDFYGEGLLIWLEADVTIRGLTKGQKSLDDFARLFYGGPGALGARGPLGGVEGSGWRLVLTDKKPELQKLIEQQPQFGGQDLRYSLGLVLGKDGAVMDVIHDGPAYQAGLGQGMKLVAVNGRGYTAEVMNAALRAGKGGSQPLELLAENTGYFRTYPVKYSGGEKYPQLLRDESKPDLLQQILAPAASP